MSFLIPKNNGTDRKKAIALCCIRHNSCHSSKTARYNYWHSDPDCGLVHKQPESTREHLSMRCSMIKGLDVVQARCTRARTHSHKHTHTETYTRRENMASPGKHCLCSFASLELTHKEKTQPINNKQQHNHFCFRGHSAQDRKQKESTR